MFCSIFPLFCLGGDEMEEEEEIGREYEDFSLQSNEYIGLCSSMLRKRGWRG